MMAARESRRAAHSGPPPTFALALGGGGARGLAHVAVLEALDELELRPSAIAGTSIGAAIGAAYSAGLSGRTIRRYLIDLAHNRAEVFARLLRARAITWSEILSAGFGNPMVLDAQQFCAGFLPTQIPEYFEALTIPLTVIATDLYARSEARLTAGALRPAIAASLAVPGLLQPVEINGRLLVDGAASNPLPFDALRTRADFVVAVDCSVGPIEPRGIPDPWECLFTTLQVMGQTIVSEKLKHGAPDLLLRPNVGAFRMLEFFQASAILRASEPIKADVKRRLSAMLVA
jgi:NTE family protein